MLTLHSLTLQFGGLIAIRDLSCAINQGEIVSLIGPNGAGKTSVFNIISGIYRPTSGSLAFQGEDLVRPLTRRAWIWIFVSALFFATASPLILSLPLLWEMLITSQYSLGSPYSFLHTLNNQGDAIMQALSWGEIVIISLCGACIGGGGQYVWYASARFSPEQISQRGIARTFQNIRLFGDLSVLDTVRCALDTKMPPSFLSTLLHLSPHQHHERSLTTKAKEILTLLGLESHLLSPATALPYGLQRRLEIARAIATSPHLLLLDEPAAGLNPTETLDLITCIRTLRAQGITILLIEHDMHLVMEISDRIIVLHHGEKIAEGSPAEIKKHPAVIEAYLGKESHS